MQSNRSFIAPLSLTLVCLLSALSTQYLLVETIPSLEKEDQFESYCSTKSITATSQDEIWITRDSNPAQAVEVVERNGMGLFSNLLSDDLASRLRKYITTANTDPSQHFVFVIEGETRHHLMLGVDDDPVVQEALESILTAQPLRPVLEHLLGKDAALVEFAAITVKPGSAEQNWHKDTYVDDRDAPLYSLFIPLQETAADMGPTAFCAGTHQCSHFRSDAVDCDTLGKTIRGTTPSGVGALMNSRLFHRGSAHTNETAPERVMVYTTWTYAATHPEHRLLPGGTTYALRWDQWGRTLDQLTSKSYAWWSSIDFVSSSRGWNYFEKKLTHLADQYEHDGIQIHHLESLRNACFILTYIAIGMVLSAIGSWIKAQLSSLFVSKSQSKLE